MAGKKSESAAVTIVTFFLALGFIWVGLVGFLRPEPVAQLYIALGYPGWLPQVVGPLIICGAILLFFRSKSWIGALILSVVVVGVVAPYLWHRAYFEAVIPGLLLISLSSLVYYRFPRKALPA